MQVLAEASNMDLAGKKIVIAGGSGFLGLSMATHMMSLGAQVKILSRTTPKHIPERNNSQFVGDWESILWDGRTSGPWVSSLEGADAVINLAGRSVNCRKTPDHQDEILRSRVDSTQALGEAMRTLKSPPPLWIQMSTAHIYGDPPETVCDEDSIEGIGFATEIGRAWEQAYLKSKLPDQRGIIFRTSFVIGKDRGAGGGAMSTLCFLARIGLGGRVGGGKQGMSWIHEIDLNRLFTKAVVDEQMSGIYIASAPNPVSQVEFMRTLRKVLRVPVGLPAYEWMVRIGAPLLFRTDPELALYGRYVKSRRLTSEHFEFQFPDLESALRNLFSNS